MEPFSDAPHSQKTPTAQVEPIAQAVPTATPTNAEVPPFPPKDKGKVCNNRKKSITWDNFEKSILVKVILRLFAITIKKLI